MCTLLPFAKSVLRVCVKGEVLGPIVKGFDLDGIRFTWTCLSSSFNFLWRLKPHGSLHFTSALEPRDCLTTFCTNGLSFLRVKIIVNGSPK